MFKAMALICSVWIADGKAKQECFTHMFKWKFETREQCQLRLIQYRMYEIPKNYKIILDDCVLAKKS